MKGSKVDRVRNLIGPFKLNENFKGGSCQMSRRDKEQQKGGHRREEWTKKRRKVHFLVS